MNLEGPKELLRDGWRDVNDADRCYNLGIMPSTGTLYRRLREVLNSSNALIDEIERQRAELELWHPGYVDEARTGVYVSGPQGAAVDPARQSKEPE